jgi:hypothetical protein
VKIRSDTCKEGTPKNVERTLGNWKRTLVNMKVTLVTQAKRLMIRGNLGDMCLPKQNGNIF